MPDLYLFDTFSKEKKRFEPIKAPEVLFYACGPTVYNYAHIGNFRAYIFEDLLRRALEYFGFDVQMVMNITDVDDKTIKGAFESNMPLKEFSAKYTAAFFEDIESLNILKALHYPKASDHISDMIRIIEKLLQDEIAYQGQDGSIYFAIQRFKEYGKLSGLVLEDLQCDASQRVSNDEYDKENASDFVLWKAYDPKRDAKIYWESPFGKGRPGWHIECSAMAMKTLGPSIDLHTGGVDNIFPHHENEIAQSEAYSKKPFVRFWMHAEHLLVDNKKMSKSLGNFYTLRDLLQMGYEGKHIRYMLLQSHYRMQLNFTIKALDAAKQSMQRLQDFVERLKSIQGNASFDPKEILQNVKETFDAALADDLNIASALASLFDLVRECNKLCDQSLIGKTAAEQILAFLKQVNQVLAIFVFEQEDTIPQELLEKLELRKQARAEKDFASADHIRKEIETAGYLIEDGPQGAKLKKK